MNGLHKTLEYKDKLKHWSSVCGFEIKTEGHAIFDPSIASKKYAISVLRKLEAILESKITEDIHEAEKYEIQKLINEISESSPLKDREAEQFIVPEYATKSIETDVDEELEELRTYKHVCNESIAHLDRANEELLEALKDLHNSRPAMSDYWKGSRSVEVSALIQKHTKQE